MVWSGQFGAENISAVVGKSTSASNESKESLVVVCGLAGGQVGRAGAGMVENSLKATCWLSVLSTSLSGFVFLNALSLQNALLPVGSPTMQISCL